MSRKDVIIIRGAPGSGKSQVAKCLSEYFPKGVRLEIDTLRSMVISVDWTNQVEHKNMLNLSAKLVLDFVRLDFNPVIVIDTFSGGKLKDYLEKLYQLNSELAIHIFGLYTQEDELKKRIQARKQGEFRKYEICKRLNEEVINENYVNENQIDTTGLLPEETAKLIIQCLK